MKGIAEQNKKLTKREREVINQVCKGLNNREIAEVLNVAEKTVKTHLENIYFKLSIHSKIGLSIYALKNNLVEIEI